MKVTEYKIVSKDSALALGRAVDGECFHGWNPYGNPFTDTSTTGETTFHQALVKYNTK